MRVGDCWSWCRWQTRTPSHSAPVGTVEVAAGYDICHLVDQPIQRYSLLATYRQVKQAFALKEKIT